MAAVPMVIGVPFPALPEVDGWIGWSEYDSDSGREAWDSVSLHEFAAEYAKRCVTAALEGK